MLIEERKNYILKKLYEDGRVIVGELSNELSVSTETIRRDIDALEDKGFLKRTHGGGVLPNNISTDVPAEVRRELYRNIKMELAKIAIAYIPTGGTIFLDSSTTSLEIADMISIGDKLTIFTNSLMIANVIQYKPNIDLRMIGGQLNRVNASFSGPYAFDYIENIYVDAAFLSPTGLDKDGIVSDSNEDEAHIRSKILANSKKSFLVIDNTKLYRKSTYTVGLLNEFSSLILESNFPKDLNALIKDNKFNVDVIIKA